MKQLALQRYQLPLTTNHWLLRQPATSPSSKISVTTMYARLQLARLKTHNKFPPPCDGFTSRLQLVDLQNLFHRLPGGPNLYSDMHYTEIPTHLRACAKVVPLAHCLVRCAWDKLNSNRITWIKPDKSRPATDSWNIRQQCLKTASSDCQHSDFCGADKHVMFEMVKC